MIELKLESLLTTPSTRGIARDCSGHAGTGTGAGATTIAGLVDTGSHASEIAVWDADTRVKLAAIRGGGRAHSVASHPLKPSVVAYGAGGGCAAVFDYRTAQQLWRIPARDGLGPVTSVAFSRDGRRLAIAGNALDGGASVVEVYHWERESASSGFGVAEPSSAAAPPAAEDDRAAELMQQLRQAAEAIQVERPNLGNAAVAAVEAAFPGPSVRGSVPVRPHLVLAGHSAAVLTVLLHPDGDRTLSGSEDGTLRVWGGDASAVHTLPGNEGPGGAAFAVTCIALHGRGGMCASACANIVKVWGLDSGRCLFVLRATSQLRSVAFCGDHRHLVTGGGYGAVQLWDYRQESPCSPPCKGVGATFVSAR